MVDLLQLKVPKLFAIDEGSDEMAEKEDMEVAKRFTFFLRNYVNRHALKQSLLAQMSTLLVCKCTRDLYLCITHVFCVL